MKNAKTSQMSDTTPTTMSGPRLTLLCACTLSGEGGGIMKLERQLQDLKTKIIIAEARGQYRELLFLLKQKEQLIQLLAKKKLEES